MGIKVKLTLHLIKKKKKEKKKGGRKRKEGAATSSRQVNRQVFVPFLHDCIFSYKRCFWPTMIPW